MAHACSPGIQPGATFRSYIRALRSDATVMLFGQGANTAWHLEVLTRKGGSKASASFSGPQGCLQVQLKVPSSLMLQVHCTPALGMETGPWLQGLPKNWLCIQQRYFYNMLYCNFDNITDLPSCVAVWEDTKYLWVCVTQFWELDSTCTLHCPLL